MDIEASIPIEGLPAVYLETDPVGRVTGFNASAMRVLGAGLAVGRPLRDVVDASGVDRVLEEIDVTIDTRPVVVRLDLDAGTLIGAVTIEFPVDGPLLRWILVLDDDPAGARSLAALPAVTYEAEPDQMWTCRRIGQRVEDLLGIRPQTWTSEPHLWLSVIHPDDRERVISDRMRVVETGAPLSTDYRIVVGDDRVVWVHDEAALGDDGRIHGLLIDTGRQHQLEDVLRRLHDGACAEVKRLRAQQDRREVFFRTLVHDIRAVLSGVLVALDDDHPASRAREGVARARDLVSTVLDLEGLGPAAEPRPLDLQQLLDSVVTEVDVDGHPVTVDAQEVVARVDPLVVRRVIANLVGNAAKHTPTGTPIRITAGLVRQGAVIAVEDDGPGIADVDKVRVFEPFHRGSHSDGSGLGLTLVRELVELHNGRVWVEDLPLGGTAFLVLFPQ